MKTILFDSRNWLCGVQSKMHEYFLKHDHLGIKPVSVFHNALEYGPYRSLPNTDLLTDYWESGARHLGVEQLREFEKKYFFIPIWDAVYSDRFLHDKDFEHIRQQLSFYIYAWEKILDRFKPDIVVTETVTGVWNMILFFFCNQLGITFLGLLPTKNTNRYFYSRDIYGHFPELERRYSDLRNRELNDGEIALANDFINKFKDKPIVPEYMHRTVALPSLGRFFKPVRIFKDILKDIKQRHSIGAADYKLGYRMTNKYQNDLLRLSRIGYSRFYHIFDEPSFDDKYILFPLHYQPEASTDIWAAYYADQLHTIKLIARSLPFDYWLYVKEHSAVLGSKSVKFYRELKKYPNVKLIDPWCDINHLIRHAAAISVLTGTTGLEAIFWDKPVIIFGSVLYDVYKHLYRISDLRDLPDVINRALNDTVTDPSMERLKFIYAYITSGYNGNIFTSTLTEPEIKQYCENLLLEIQ